MSKKQLGLILLAVVIGGLWLYLYSDWFMRQRIQIHTRLLPPTLARLQKRLPASVLGKTPGAAPMMFEWDRMLKLTDVEVIPLSALQTNQYASDVWHLVSDSNSPPTRGLIYGESVPGMRPATKGLEPESLVEGEKYRFVIRSGKLKAEHDFVVGSLNPQ